MQKIKKTVDTLYTEKQKMEKEKSKKGGKGKGKASIRKIDDNVRMFSFVYFLSKNYSFDFFVSLG